MLYSLAAGCAMVMYHINIMMIVGLWRVRYKFANPDHSELMALHRDVYNCAAVCLLTANVAQSFQSIISLVGSLSVIQLQLKSVPLAAVLSSCSSNWWYCDASSAACSSLAYACWASA